MYGPPPPLKNSLLHTLVSMLKDFGQSVKKTHNNKTCIKYMRVRYKSEKILFLLLLFALFKHKFNDPKRKNSD